MFTLKHVFMQARWTLVAIIIALLFTATLMWLVESKSEAQLAALAAADEEPDNNIQTWDDAFWYCIVTASTVGYGDTFPVSGLGRWIGGLYILMTLVFLGTVLGNVTSAVNEANRLRFLGMDGCKFENHLILCGWSRIADVAMHELLASDKKVAVIVQTEELVALVRDSVSDEHAPNFYITVGDPSASITLERSNIAKAATIIASSDDDTLNLITSINVRSKNPACRVIVYIKREELRSTLEASHVTYVASPFELSGRLIASAAFEPEVALLVDAVSSSQGGHDLQQFMATPSSPIVGKTIREVRETLLSKNGSLLVAHARADDGGTYRVAPNPAGDIVLQDKDALIVMGNDDENDITAGYLGCEQGR
ncbi:MAG: TrkA family potassium uptake protein [Planctomycetota bacterium]